MPFPKLEVIMKYSFLALNAVANVQAEVGASNGDNTVALTKKQLAVAYVLAAAHAGENVQNSTVQTIAAIVDLHANIAKSFGLFGKVADPSKTIAVPAKA